MTDRVSCMDALEWLRRLRTSSVSAVWTSPPYNLADELRGGGGREAGEFRYAGGDETRGDGLVKDEAVYQQEQAAVLSQCYRVLEPLTGVCFYSHKVRIKDGEAISPLKWIFKTPFVLLQELVWDRGGTAQVADCRFLPVSERVYVLTTRPFVKLANVHRTPDVLRIPPTHHTRKESGHPCPTHPAIVRACLDVLPRPKGRRLLVADPYAGIGTTGIVARELGMDYLLNDHSEVYASLIRANLERPAALPLDLAA